MEELDGEERSECKEMKSSSSLERGFLSGYPATVHKNRLLFVNRRTFRTSGLAPSAHPFSRLVNSFSFGGETKLENEGRETSPLFHPFLFKLSGGGNWPALGSIVGHDVGKKFQMIPDEDFCRL